MRTIIRHLLVLCLISNALLAMESALPDPSIESQKDLNLAVLREFQIITADYFHRLKRAKEIAGTKEGMDILNQSFWYPTDYYDLLEQNAQVSKLDCNEAQEMLNRMKTNNGFIKGHTSSQSLKLDAKEQLTYWLMSEVSPSNVVLHLGNDLILIDCSIAYQLAYYRAALTFLGEDTFDWLFGLGNPLPMFALEISKTKLSLVTSLDTIMASTPGDIGTNFYIWNHPLYLFKDPYGHAQGLNLLVAGKNHQDETIYIGLGLNPEGLNEAQVKAELVRLFNHPQYSDRLITEMQWDDDDVIGLKPLLFAFLRNVEICSTDDRSMLNRLSSHLRNRMPLGDHLFNDLSARFAASNKRMTAPYLDYIRLSYRKKH